MAVRARNNQPDYYCQKMTALRKVVIFGSLADGAALIVLRIVWDIMEFWLVAGCVVAALVAVIAALVTWPRIDQLALIGPGIHLKIPGYWSYKKGKVLLRTRTVVLMGIKDASGALVNVDVQYTTHRVSDDAALLWLSVNGIANLEDSLNEIIKRVAGEVVRSTSAILTLAEPQVVEMVDSVQDRCEGAFLGSYGSTLRVLGFPRVAPPESVEGMRMVADALRETAPNGHVPGVASFAPVADAGNLIQDSTA